MKKQIEIVAVILAILVFVGLGAVAVVWLCFLPAAGAGATALFILHLGTAIWLFQQADPKSDTAGVWAFLGAIAGLVAVLIFFLSEINRKLTTLTNNMDSTTTH